MENTEWYVAIDDEPTGPMTATAVLAKLQAQEISWVHYGWKKGMSEWKRLCDIPTFAKLAPKAPPKTMKPNVKQAEPRKAEKSKREWFLYYNDAQFGPFAAHEIRHYIEIGKIHGGVYVWKDGLENWQRLDKVVEFQPKLEKTKSKPIQAEARSDKRGGPRRPMVARIMMASGEQLAVGVCRDVSVGGMQVLTAELPKGGVGSRLKLNVSNANPGERNFEPFVAEGVIVRILEDGRGFSFRFEKLGEDARRAIEKHITNG